MQNDILAPTKKHKTLRQVLESAGVLEFEADRDGEIRIENNLKLSQWLLVRSRVDHA